MNAWDAKRDDLKALLVDVPALQGWAVETFVPEKAVPPIAVVDFPDPPYVDFEGCAFGGANLYLEVIVALQRGTNDVNTTAVNEALMAVMYAVEDADPEFTPLSVAAGPVVINGQMYPGGVVRCRTEVHRGGA